MPKLSLTPGDWLPLLFFLPSLSVVLRYWLPVWVLSRLSIDCPPLSNLTWLFWSRIRPSLATWSVLPDWFASYFLICERLENCRLLRSLLREIWKFLSIFSLGLPCNGLESCLRILMTCGVFAPWVVPPIEVAGLLGRRVCGDDCLFVFELRVILFIVRKSCV